MNTRSKDWHQELTEKILNSSEGQAEYIAFKAQLELADKLKHAREQAHMTQESVAKKMATQKSVVARLEAAGGRGQHSPSLTTLIRYANAIDCDLRISLKRRSTR